jgi:hypothetical protein
LVLLAPSVGITHAAVCSTSNTQFVVTNTFWGTPGSPAQVQPGDTGVPLTVTLVYVGSCPILAGSFSLSLPAGFTAANPQAGSTVYLENISPYTAVNLIFNLNIVQAPAVNVGNSLSSSLAISYTFDGSTYNYVTTSVGAQVLGKVSLNFNVSPRSLVAGQVNELTVSITNNGTGVASLVNTAVASSALASVLGVLPELDSIPASSSYTRGLSVYVSGAAVGQPLPLVFSATYADPYSNTRTVSQSVGLYAPSGPESVNLNILASQVDLSAGETTTVLITIQNSGSGPAKNLTLSVSPSQLVSVLNLPPKIPLLSSGTQLTFPLEIFTSSAAAGSPVNLPVSVQYLDPYSLTKVYTQSVGFYATTLGQAQLQFSARNPQLTPGNETEVQVVVSNIGTGTAYNLTLSFIPAGTSLTAPSVSVLKAASTIPRLAGHSSIIVPVEIFTPVSAAGQSITLSVNGQYTGSSGNSRTTGGQLGLYVASIYVQASIGLSGYSYEPTLIFPGTTVAALQVVLANVGTTPATNLNVTLVPSRPAYAISSGSLSRSFGLVPAGQSIPITFQLGIQNSSETINSTLTLVVKLSSSNTERFSIPFREQPKAEFVIFGSTVPQIASGDGADQVTITLHNSGKATAQSVVFTLVPSYVFEPSTQGSFTATANSGAGTLGPGESTNLTLVIQVNSNLEPGSYPLVIHVVWTQLGGSQPFGQDITVVLPVRASTFQVLNSVLFSLPFLAVLVILISVLAVRRVRGRARRRSKEATVQ